MVNAFLCGRHPYVVASEKPKYNVNKLSLHTAYQWNASNEDWYFLHLNLITDIQNFCREEHCIFKWESLILLLLLQHVSISSSFLATYTMVICNQASMSSWHEVLFCCQVLSNFSDNAELGQPNKASTK